MEGRILATTILLAGHGALAVPAAILWDQRRLSALAALVAGLAALAATLSTVAVWWDGAGDDFGKTIADAEILLLVAVVTAALAARPRHRLFLPSVALAAVVATMATVAIWGEVERSGYLRLLGALVVLYVLLVALQPLLLRARRTPTTLPLRVVETSGRSADVSVQADSLADAFARAIRDAERQGRSVRSVEVLERAAGANGSIPR